jgi:signal transduction histidine kinase
LLARSRGADAEVRQGLDRAHRLARTGLQESRQTITALRGEAVPGPELIPALVAEHREATGRPCRLVEHGTARPLPPNSRLTLYRTAQEALSNVRKHAPGAEVTVLVSWEEDQVRLEVDDTGQLVTVGAGQSVERSDAGYGLTGMDERAQLVGGTLEAGPTDRGFRVVLQLPVPQEAT